MAQNRTDNFAINAPKDIDQRRLKNGTTVYASVSEAHSLITYKYRTLTCVIMDNGVPTEYWYRDATASSSDLVIKTPILDRASLTGVQPISTITNLQSSLDLKAPLTSISVVGLSGNYTDLIGKPNLSSLALSGAWTDITGKPTISGVNTGDETSSTIITKLGYTPANRATIITINGVSHNLSQDNSWVIATDVGSVSWGTINGSITGQTDLSNALNGKASLVHTHAIADVTSLQTTLNNKSDIGHVHILADVTGLQTALNGKASLSHTHLIADTTGLQSALDGKQAVGSYIVGNTAISGATGTKVTYDSKGLVLSSTNATTADITDTTNKRYVTDANLTVIGNAATKTGVETLTGKTMDGSLNIFSNIPATALAIGDIVTFDPSTKQDVLVSGTNIKTYNGVSILGSGDLSGGGSSILSAKDYLFYDDFSRANTFSSSSGFLGTSASGQTYISEINAGSNGGTSNISSKQWVSSVVGSTTGVAFDASINTTQSVTSAGAKFKWTGGDNILSDGEFSIMISPDYPNKLYNGIIITIKRSLVQVYVKTSGSFTLNKNIFYGYTLPKNVDTYVDVKIIRNTLYLNIAGFKTSLSHPAISTQGGNYVTFEEYFNEQSLAPSTVQGFTVTALWAKMSTTEQLTQSLLQVDNSRHSLTGTLTKTAVYTLPIRANTIGLNGILKIESLYSWTNTANAKTVEIEVGGVQIGYLQTSGNSGFQCVTRLAARDSQIVNVGAHPSNNMSASTPATVIVYDASGGKEINWAVDNNLIVYLTLADTSETAALEDIQIYANY